MNLDEKLSHLPVSENCQLKQFIHKVRIHFSDVANIIDAACSNHMLLVSCTWETANLLQHSHRVNPMKWQGQREVDYILMTYLSTAKVNGVHHVFWFRNQIVYSDLCRTSVKSISALRLTLVHALMIILTKSAMLNCKQVWSWSWQVTFTDSAKEISKFCTPDTL